MTLSVFRAALEACSASCGARHLRWGPGSGMAETPLEFMSIFNARLYPSRSIELEAQELDHAFHIGMMLYSWNRAHAKLFALFKHLLNKENEELTTGLWYTIKDDSSQRRMLAAVVASLSGDLKYYRQPLLWAIKAMDAIATYRNDAAHAEMQLFLDLDGSGQFFSPSDFNKSELIRRLEEKPVSETWQKVCGDLNAIYNYLNHIDFSLRLSAHRPLTRRPSLQSVRIDTAQSQAKRRRAKLAVRERQRQSSSV